MDPKIQLMLACLKIRHVGMQSVRRYLDTVIDAEDVLENFDLLKDSNVITMRNAVTSGILNQEIWKKYVDLSFEEGLKAEKKKIQIISYRDKNYPKNLLTLKRYPPVLYAKGNLDLLNHPRSVAIVGTRKPTFFGKEICLEISKRFTQNEDYVIISGLAKGCDTYAHQAAMETTKKTIAILASGLDQNVYPKQNQKVAEEIAETGGLLLSANALGIKTMPHLLAARDEWQSGISDGTIAIETTLKGGTNIAIKQALIQNRPLAVVDYSHCFGEQSLQKIPQTLGNQKYLQEHCAFGIYSEKSFDDFERRMHEDHARRFW